MVEVRLNWPRAESSSDNKPRETKKKDKSLEKLITTLDGVAGKKCSHEYYYNHHQYFFPVIMTSSNDI